MRCCAVVLLRWRCDEGQLLLADACAGRGEEVPFGHLYE